MSNSVGTHLCRTCRNLNLRIDSFINTGWRSLTSLRYETVLDNVDDSTEEIKAKHYAVGEHIEDDRDYTDEELGMKLKAPTFIPEFDEDDGLLLNIPPAKSKILGRLGQLRARASNCRLCQLIVQQVHVHYQELPEDSGNEACTDEDLCKIQLHYDGQGGGYMIRGLMEHDESLAYGRYDCKIGVGQSVEINLYPLPADPELTWLGGRPYEPQINFSLVKHWAESCMKTHERCGTQSWHSHIKDISLFRFIDVKNMCLVDASKKSQFVALSYVWGTVPIFKATLQNKAQLYSKMGLSQFIDEIPTTIQDAIQVVRELGMRFLWTDAICIIQDDWEEKKQLIGGMDAVYAQATLTIVAAQGTNASSGLLGVRPESRKVPQVFEYSPEVKFLVAATPLPDLFLKCPWSTRGWTYQEGLLSARLLVFTNDAAHFACNSTCWSEDLNNISEGTPPPWKFATGSQYNFRATLTDLEVEATQDPGADPLSDLWQTVVGELSNRNISYESDILFAGAGIFHLLEEIFGVQSLWGIPESRLEDFLFWSPIHSGTLRRRKGDFPTWSWSGWVGEVSWTGGWTEEAHTSHDPIEWMKIENPGTEPIVLDLGGRGKRVISGSGNRKPLRDVQNEWRFLQFESRIYTLRVSKDTSAPEWAKELLPFAWSYVPEKGQERQGVCCITTRNDPEQVVGSMVLDSLDEILDKDFLDAYFAIISSEPQTLDVGDFAGQVFHNLLALSFDGRIYQRIGHGRILDEFVLDNPSKKQRIILG
jgi:hypothetical protein